MVDQPFDEDDVWHLPPNFGSLLDPEEWLLGAIQESGRILWIKERLPW